MPPKARRGRPKKKVDEEPEEARTSESDLDQQDRTSENENESSEHDMPMEQEQNEVQIPDDENSTANLKRQYDEEQDTVQPETKKTKVEDMDADRAEEDDIAEERLYMNVDGFVLSGQIDLQVKDGDGYLVHDYKTTSASTLTYNPDGKREWEEQLNIYATLVEQSTGRKVNGIGVWAIIRDWSKVQAGRKEGYPEAPVVLVSMSLWDSQERMDFIRSRVLKHSMVEGIDDESILPECTKEERWAKDKTYAVYNFTKAGVSRVRATRVFDTADEAITFGKGKGVEYRVEERMGKNTRCESWCDFKEYCSQYKQIIGN